MNTGAVGDSADTGSMRRPKRVSLLALVAATTIALTGCSTYDGVLWRQLDRQEGFALDLISQAERDRIGHGQFRANLTSSEAFWDGSADPSMFASGGPASAIYNVTESVDDFGDPTVSFDVLVFSGLRPVGVPRDDAGQAGGAYTGPPSVYTCYRLSVTFVAGTVWSRQRSHYYGPDQLPCPAQLVDTLGPGAAYGEPWEFDG